MTSLHYYFYQMMMMHEIKEFFTLNLIYGYQLVRRGEWLVQARLRFSSLTASIDRLQKGNGRLSNEHLVI